MCVRDRGTCMEIIMGNAHYCIHNVPTRSAGLKYVTHIHCTHTYMYIYRVSV